MIPLSLSLCGAGFVQEVWNWRGTSLSFADLAVGFSIPSKVLLSGFDLQSGGSDSLLHSCVLCVPQQCWENGAGVQMVCALKRTMNESEYSHWDDCLKSMSWNY